MKVLVINCGSSSLKYQLIEMDTEEEICNGKYERIGENSVLTHKVARKKYVYEHPAKDHTEALKFAMKELMNKDHPAIKNLKEIYAVGHRIVQGGDHFKDSALIDDEVIEQIRKLARLAPLHNLAAISGIEGCRKLMPDTPMVAVFDTAFHQTIPPEHYMYPIPGRYYRANRIRKYGAHGTSHYYISRRVAEIMHKDVKDLKIINCHLGQGASICAIEKGKSIETSMGLTPLGGIPMCARSGDLDPSVVTFIMKKEKIDPDKMEDILNKKSGVYGICSVSPDFRDVEKEGKNGNRLARLGLRLYAYRVAQFIAKYIVSLGGCDVITFTAGIGEHQASVRKKIIDNLGFLGVKISKKKNEEVDGEALISKRTSTIPVYVIPTNEELMIAKDAVRLSKKSKG